MTGPEELSYKVSYTEALRDVHSELRAVKEAQTVMASDLRSALNENADLKTRVRALELRFYGILAGLLTAVGILVYNGRTP